MSTVKLLLKQYTRKKNITEFDKLIAQGLKEDFLSEDINDYDFDTMENRFFGETIKLDNKVFRQEFIKFRNSKKVSISNSIIIGNIVLLSSNGSIDLHLDNCIIAGKLSFSGSDVGKIEFVDSNISSLRFYNSNFEDVCISNCRVGNFSIANSKLKQMYWFCNTINFIEKYQSQISELTSTGDSIDFEKIIKGKKPCAIDLVDFIDMPADKMFESIENPNETKIETIHFLKDTKLLSQKRAIEQLADVELTCLSENKRIYQCIVRLLSGFTKPSLFFIFAVTIIVSFALYYYLFGTLKCGEVDCTSFWEAFYFSGVSFSTIGYGDMAPLGYTRLFAVLEGLLGILTCTGFLVSIVNKYTKGN